MEFDEIGVSAAARMVLLGELYVVRRTDLQPCEQLAYVHSIAVEAAGMSDDLSIQLVFEANVHAVHEVFENALGNLIFDEAPPSILL